MASPLRQSEQTRAVASVAAGAGDTSPKPACWGPRAPWATEIGAKGVRPWGQLLETTVWVLPLRYPGEDGVTCPKRSSSLSAAKQNPKPPKALSDAGTFPQQPGLVEQHPSGLAVLLLAGESKDLPLHQPRRTKASANAASCNSP